MSLLLHNKTINIVLNILYSRFCFLECWVVKSFWISFQKTKLITLIINYVSRLHDQLYVASALWQFAALLPGSNVLRATQNF